MKYWLYPYVLLLFATFSFFFHRYDRLYRLYQATVRSYADDVVELEFYRRKYNDEYEKRFSR